MKKENFLLITMIISILSYIFSNFFILFQINVIKDYSFNLGSLMFPILYITSDLIQEIYGYEKSRLAGKLTMFSQIAFALLCFISMKYFNILWLDETANQIIKENILGSVASVITIASVISYYLGDWVNDIFFQKFNNNKDGLKDYGKRAFISSFFGKIVDTGLFNILLLLLPNSQFTIKIILIPTIIEILIEFLFLPISHKIVMFAKKEIKN